MRIILADIISDFSLRKLVTLIPINFVVFIVGEWWVSLERIDLRVHKFRKVGNFKFIKFLIICYSVKTKNELIIIIRGCQF
jgi:hypothetical protein